MVETPIGAWVTVYWVAASKKLHSRLDCGALYQAQEGWYGDSNKVYSSQSSVIPEHLVGKFCRKCASV